MAQTFDIYSETPEPPEIPLISNPRDIPPWKVNLLKEAYFSRDGKKSRGPPIIFMWPTIRGARRDHVTRAVVMFTYATEVGGKREWKNGMGIGQVMIDIYEIALRRKEFFVRVTADSDAPYEDESNKRKILITKAIFHALNVSIETSRNQAEFRGNKPVMGSYVTTEPGIFMFNAVLRARTKSASQKYMTRQKDFYQHNSFVYEAVLRAGFIVITPKREYVWRKVEFDEKFIKKQLKSNSDSANLWAAMDDASHSMQALQYNACGLRDVPVEDQRKLAIRETFCAVLDMLDRIDEAVDSDEEILIADEHTTLDVDEEEEGYDAILYGTSDTEEEEEAEASMPPSKITKPKPTPIEAPPSDNEWQSTATKMIRAASDKSGHLFVLPRSMAENSSTRTKLDDNLTYNRVYTQEFDKRPAYVKTFDSVLRVALSAPRINREEVTAPPSSGNGKHMTVGVKSYIEDILEVLENIETIYGHLSAPMARMTDWVSKNNLLVSDMTSKSASNLTYFYIRLLIIHFDHNKKQVSFRDSRAPINQMLAFTGVFRRGSMPQYKEGVQVIEESKITRRNMGYPR